MRSRLVPILVALALAAAPALGVESSAELHIDAYVGVLQGDDDTEPIDRRTELGLLADITFDVLPVGFCANLLWCSEERSGGDAGELSKLVSTDLQLGICRHFGGARLRPFIAGGATLLYANLDAVGTSDDHETAIGAWASLGVRTQLMFVDLGIALGYTWAEVHAFGRDIDMGGWRAGGFAGIRL